MVFCSFPARCGRAVPIRDGAGRLAQGDPQEVHLRGDAAVPTDIVGSSYPGADIMQQYLPQHILLLCIESTQAVRLYDG